MKNTEVGGFYRPLLIAADRSLPEVMATLWRAGASTTWPSHLHKVFDDEDGYPYSVRAWLSPHGADVPTRLLYSLTKTLSQGWTKPVSTMSAEVVAAQTSAIVAWQACWAQALAACPPPDRIDPNTKLPPLAYLPSLLSSLRHKLDSTGWDNPGPGGWTPRELVVPVVTDLIGRHSGAEVDFSGCPDVIRAEAEACWLRREVPVSSSAPCHAKVRL